MFAHIDPSVSAEKPATLEITHPATGDVLLDDGGKPITISLVGINSDKGKRGIARMVMEDEKKGKQSKPKTVDEVLGRMEEGQSARADLYAQITVGWSGITYLPKEERSNPKAKPEVLEFSPSNAKLLYSEYVWVADQVKDFLEDEANFMTLPEGK